MRPTFAAGVILLAGGALFAARKGEQPTVPVVDILELDLKMARFLVEHVSPGSNPRTRVSSLVDALFSDKGLGITYENTGTKTAIETFRSGSGNCLSFTILFVAMARHIGLDAYFQEVGEVMSWDQRGEIVLLNQHMYAEVEILNGRVQVDFLPGLEKRYRMVKRISDGRAHAHYYNNLGAETLAEGDAALALAYFRRALEVEQDFAHAWTNMGVAHRHLGEIEQAERCHLRALEIEPNQPTAMTNLARLYLASGRHDKAEPLLGRIETHLRGNPFHQFRLGVIAADTGETLEAIRRFKEAIRRIPEEAEFHAALAEAYARADDRSAAEASLKRAIDLTVDPLREQELRAKLEALLPR